MVNYKELISVDQNIRFGKPCIKGSRIAISDILQLLASGMSREEIIDVFPELTNEDILASINYTAN